MLQGPTHKYLAGSLLVLAACQKLEQPREVSVDFPEVVASGDPVRLIVRITRSDGVRAESDGSHELSVEPPELAALARDGSLRCRRSGDGQVRVKIGSAESARPLKCRLVSRIEHGDIERLEMSGGPVDPKLRVLDAAGRELADVPVSLTSSATSVIQARGALLLPLKVGRASVLARAGDTTKELKLEVVRRLNPEALPINDNKRIHFSLEAGRYELSIKLPEARKVSVEWRGAPYCGATSTGTEHGSTCTLQGKGGVVFDNPAFLKDGGKTVSTEGVSLYEIP
jgi:hypothetical protein